MDGAGAGEPRQPYWPSDGCVGVRPHRVFARRRKGVLAVRQRRRFHAPHGRPGGVVRAARSGEPRALRELGLGPLPAGFDAWFFRAVNRDHTARFQTIDSALATLVPLLGVATPAPGAMAPFSAYAPASVHREPGSVPVRTSPNQTPADTSQMDRTSRPSGLPVDPRWSDEQRISTGTVIGGVGFAASQPGIAAPSGAARRHGSPVGWILAAVAVVAVAAVSVAVYVAKGRPSTAQDAGCSTSALDVCESACAAARADGSANADKLCLDYGDAVLHSDNVDRAVTVYQSACDASAGAACDRLGAIVGLNGRKVHDVKKATALFQRACDAKIASGCAHLGYALESGWAEGGASKATGLYEKACSDGEGKACAFWAEAIRSGRGGATPDVTKADVTWAKGKASLESGCKGGDGEACSLLGVADDRSGNLSEARTFYKKGCDLEDGLGCTNLAHLDLEGTDPAGALQSFTKLCGNGEAAACDDQGIVEARLPSQTRFGPRGEIVYKFNCDQAMQAGCSAWGESRILPGGGGDLAKAFEALKRGCDLGSTIACVNSGGLMYLGHGAKKDRPGAHGLFDKACAAGDPSGCGESGSLYQTDYIEQPADLVKAYSNLAEACKSGELDACANADELLAQGKGTTKDEAAALADITSLCEHKKVPFACYSYGDIILMDAQPKRTTDVEGFKASVERAKKLISDSCDANGFGCAYLARSYYPTDPSTQFNLFQKGCDKGQLDACGGLAQSYEQAKGTEKDVGKAIELYQKGCDGGYPFSCARLGVAYLEGWKQKDAERGAALSKEACGDAEPTGCSNYAVCLDSGVGVAINPSEAVLYYKRACALGNTDACHAAQPH